MNLRLPLAVAAAVISVTLSGCFTGIESTPRITGDDVLRSGAGTVPEQEFIASVGPERPAHWRLGKQWLVDDSKIAIIFTPASSDTLAGDTLTLVSIGHVPTVMGDTAVELRLAARGDRVYSYQPGVTVADFASLVSLEIPFTVELSEVAAADSLLRGNTYYITTPLWRDASGRAVDGLRHVPVTVTGVFPGTPVRPLRVEFTHADESQTHSVFITCGTGPTANRNFDRVFSFTDPRAGYPLITDATWDRIIHSTVAVGMTRDECRLALGTPASLQRGATYAAHVEHWSYDDGTYLIFEDGILTRFRK